MSKIRVSAVQFGTGADLTENLNSCLRMIDEAAKDAPNFIVLPEFCNQSAISSTAEQANESALELNSEFLNQISAKALQHNCYIKINVTLKNGVDRPTISNLLYSPKGKLAGRSDRQILLADENEFYSPAKKAGDVVDTEVGKVGMYCGADGLLMETTRLLAQRGATLLLNSLSSFAEDHTKLHTPVRAAENGVFVVSASSVGSLSDPENVEQIAERMKLPVDALKGIGESQIVGPDGTVLARAARNSEDCISTEIDPDEATCEIVFRNRKPDLYKAIARKPKERMGKAGATRVKVAISQSYNALRNIDAQLIVFPELCFFTNGIVSNLERAIQFSAQMVNLVSVFVSGTHKHVVTSLVEKTDDGFAHVGVIINKSGIVFRQKQIHRTSRLGWITSYGEDIQTFELPFGRVAVIVGDDALYPEVFRLAAYENAEIAVCPFTPKAAWEIELGIPERSAENRVNVIVAARPSQELGPAGASLIATIRDDFTLTTTWKRAFDGTITSPIVSRATAAVDVFYGEVRPANARNRLVAPNTDVVDSRLFSLLRPLTK